MGTLCLPYHMSSAPPSEGATCSPWPFEKPWGLHVCPTHVLGAPHVRGRHVPHGHLGSHGDSPSSPMSSVHPASRGQILTQPHGLLASHTSLQPSLLAATLRIVFGRPFGAGTPAVSLQAPLHRVQRGHVRVSLRCGLHAIVVPCLPSAAVSAVLLHSGPLEARLGGSLGPWPYPFVGPQDHTRHRSRAHVARTRCQRDSASYSSEGPGASSSTCGS